MIVCEPVPTAVGVYVTEQLLLVDPVTSEHVGLLNVPLAVPLSNITVPDGADFVPASVSVTVAVHVELPP